MKKNIRKKTNTEVCIILLDFIGKFGLNPFRVSSVPLAINY